MATQKKAVKKKEEQAVATFDPTRFEDHAGAGFENADADSYAIPFLRILQSNSPQCTKSNGAYIKGAEEGMMINTVTEEIFNQDEEGLEVIPVDFQQKVIEWESDQPNSGLIEIHDIATGLDLIEKAERNDRNKDILPNGHCLQAVREHYVLIVLGDALIPAIISMSSTQLKKSRRWMSVMNGIKMKGAKGTFTAPMFSNRYRLTTVVETKESNSWMGWKIELVGPVESNDQVDQAVAFLDAIRSGVARAADPVDLTAEETEGGVDKDDVPF